jgi:hypothetical protein
MTSEPTQAAARERRRWARPRTRLAVAALGLVAAAGISVLAAGVLASRAGALSPQVAMENISTVTSPLAYQPSGSSPSSWTSLGTLSLTPGGSYVVLATIGLRVSSTDTGPVGAECALSATNEPVDLGEADLNLTKGTEVANISLEGLTNEIGSFSAPEAGSATIACHEVGNPGTPAGLVLAHDARIIVIPVDGVTSNLGTYGCLGNRAPAGAC